MESPSSAHVSATVTAAAPGFVSRSSSVMVPVAVSVAVTVADVPETARLTVKVSSVSTSVSSVVATVKDLVSPAFPAKPSPLVFSV